MQQPLTLTRKVHLYLYSTTRKFRKPIAVDPAALSQKWNCTPRQITDALACLKHKGFIKRTDVDGNEVHHEVRGSIRLLQLLLDHDGKLPWDKQSRIRYARSLGFRHSSLEVYKREFNHLLHTEYNDKGWPVQIMLLNDYDARLICDEIDTTQQGRYGCHYWKYIKGWRKRPIQKQKAPVAPPQAPTNASALICQLLLENGGTLYGPARPHYEALGLKVSTYRKAVKSLQNRGFVTKTPQCLSIRNPEAVASFLGLPTEGCQSSRMPALSASPNNLSSPKSVNEKIINYVDAFSSPLTPQQRQATGVMVRVLSSLVQKRRITTEIAQTKLRYPSYYPPRRHKLAMLYQEHQSVNEENLEFARRQRGAMFERQKDLCVRMLTTCKFLFGLTGSILKALAEETANRLEGALPTVGDPNRELGIHLAEFIDDDVPVDDQCLNWVQSWIGFSGVSSIAEFACRGGFDLLLRIMEYRRSDAGVIQHRVAWDICLYIAYCEKHGWDDRYPDQWQTISEFSIVNTQTALWQGITVAQALAYYWDVDGKTASLGHVKNLILKSLNEEYPLKGDDGEVEFYSPWDLAEEALGVYGDEYAVLCQWLDEMDAQKVVLTTPAPDKFTVQWYEGKIKDIGRFGQPEDIELLFKKIGVLKRWNKSSVEVQKDQLVPIMNRPTVVDDPRLNWDEWDQRANPRPVHVEIPGQGVRSLADVFREHREQKEQDREGNHEYNTGFDFSGCKWEPM